MKKILSDLFDMLFVLILCFLTLLIPMLMRGKVIVGTGGVTRLRYIFDFPTFMITVVTIIAYIIFLLKQSEKELRPMIRHMYSEIQKLRAGQGVDR